MKLSDVKVGDTLIADAGFTCMKPGPKTVAADADGLFVLCDEGRHGLDGQLALDGSGRLVGFSK